MKPLKAAATTSQPVLTSQQIETIFFKVPELYEIHKEFYDGLFPRVQQWSHQQRVGDLFQKLVSVSKPTPPFSLPLLLPADTQGHWPLGVSHCFLDREDTFIVPLMKLCLSLHCA